MSAGTTGPRLSAGLPTPLPVNHVGLSVPDIRSAIDWYGRAFGFGRIMGPRVLEGAAPATRETGNILGPRFRRTYQAHLLAANGVGLELFQFLEPPVEPGTPEIEYWRQGLWHLCVIDPDIEGALGRVIDLGGRQVCPITHFVPGRPWRLVYCRDPWGTTLEILSHSYPEVFANWPQPGSHAHPTWLDTAVGAPADDR